MTKQTYLDKLKNPKWQKKRLEILQRDNFTCQSCYDAESTLHVHHCFYKKGCDPWDYDNQSLVTLCDECHGVQTEYNYGIKKEIIDLLCSHGMLHHHFHSLKFALSYAPLGFFSHEPNISILRFLFENEKVLEDVSDRFWQSITIKKEEKNELV